MNKLILSLLTLVFSLFTFVPLASAKVMVEEKGNVTIATDEVINDDLFIGGESIIISGTVNGDVYAGGGDIRVDGEISGDLVVAGGSVILSSSSIGDSLIVLAGQVTIDEDSQIGGSLIAGTGTVHSSAPIGRNLMLGAGEVYLDSRVGKEARIGTGSLMLGPNTNIAGDLTYALGEESSDFTMADEATVGGTISEFIPPENWQQHEKKSAAGIYAGWSIFNYLSALLVGLLVLKLLPRSTKAVTQIAASHTLRSLVVGLLAVVVALPVFLILLITGIGAPLAFILLMLFLVYLYLSGLVTAQMVGGWLATQFGQKWNSYAMFILGLTAVSTLKFVPFFGWLIGFVACLIGLGSLLTHTRSLAGR